MLAGSSEQQVIVVAVMHAHNVARHILQEMILRSRRVRSYSAYAATYVAAWKIGRAPLVKLLQEFPKMRYVLRSLSHKPLQCVLSLHC
jgi:CRP-like cAMP-binding protein